MSKTIESAQTRVEGFNFDIRKRVVEFDDVINRQRETIYAERDKVLRNEDLTETVLGFLDDEIEVLVEHAPRHRRRPPSGTSTGWPRRSRRWASAGPAPRRRPLPMRRTHAMRCASTSRRSPTSELDAARGRGRRRSVGLVERFVLLRTIDSLWVEHLTEVDDMRRGIGLRGYAQQDPLNEFRKEAYRLYEELGDFIRRQVATTILRVNVSREPAPRPSRCPGRAAGTTRRGRARWGRVRWRPGEPAGGDARQRHGGQRHGGGRRERARDGRRHGRGTPVVGQRERGAGERPAARGPHAGGASDVERQREQRRRTGRGEAGLHAERRADRAQRPLLVRIGAQVQEVSRPADRPAGGCRTAPTRHRRSVVAASLASQGTRHSGSSSRAIATSSVPADAIVVLGAAQYDGRPSPCSRRAWSTP